MRTLTPTQERVLLFIGLAALWSAAYLGIGRAIATRPTQVLTWDPVWAFPYVPAFVVPYLSAYLLPFVAFFALRDAASSRKFSIVVAGTILASAALFVAWPLTLARPAVGLASVFDRLLGALYVYDRPTNLFPSLHVSLSFLCAVAVGRVFPRRRVWMLAWATLIAVSTLFVRQHYVIDVAGGAAVAWVAWRVFLAMG